MRTDNNDLKSLKDMLNTKAVTDLEFYPVDRQVNSVKTNKASNLEPVQMEFDFLRGCSIDYRLYGGSQLAYGEISKHSISQYIST